MSDVARCSFVLIACDSNHIDGAVDELRSIPTVTSVQRVQGIYDLVVQLRDSPNAMKETIRTKIRYVDGVRSVLTLLEESSYS